VSGKEKRIPTEGTVAVPWGRLAYKKWSGTGSALPLVAFHGWLDNANTFDSLIPRLEYPGEIYAFDLPGHGLSEHRPIGTTYYFLDGVIDAADAIAALGFEKCRLMGHSLGGGILSFLTAFQPEKFESLVLIEALGPFSAEPSEFTKHFRQFFVAREQAKTKAMPVYPSRERAIEARLSVGGMLRSSVEILCERGLKEVEGGFTWRSDSRLRLPSAFRLSEAYVLNTLAEIRCPTFFLRAKNGLDFPEPFFTARKRVVANLTEAVVLGGHHPHLDEPEATADPIAKFLSQNP